MVDELTTADLTAIVVQAVLLLFGVVILWRAYLRPAARTEPARLPRWEITGFQFAFACFLVMVGGLVGQVAMALLQPADPDVQIVLQGAGLQLGFLLGLSLAAAELRRRRPPDSPAKGSASVLVAGGATFLASLPVVLVISWGWTSLLERFGLSTDQQELLGLFSRADSPALVVTVTLLAVVAAPVVEELVFRAGLFRFLRLRVPRWIALGLPAAIFGSLHGNLVAFAPLAALGIVFSLAYERTGRIAVPMVAHALFNLNTIVLLLAGVTVDGT